MFLHCTVLERGPGPSELIIEITTDNGTEEVIIDKDILKEDAVDIGFVIARRNGHLLVELPRETVSGKSRVWVPKESVDQEIAAA